MTYTTEQICEILETPLGDGAGRYTDVEVIEARRAIQALYNRLTREKPDWSFSTASLKARSVWLSENVCSLW